jgi:serine/threonine kinase 32
VSRWIDLPSEYQKTYPFPPSSPQVRMVERRETAKVYALKYISKAQVIKMDAVRNVLRERQILETLDHAFVVNMRFAFQDDEYMYMCMDLM